MEVETEVSFAFAPYAFSESFRIEIRLWDLPTQSLITAYPQAHRGIISSLQFSPINFSNQDFISQSDTNSRSSGRRMLSCSTDRTIKLWNADPQRNVVGPDDSEDEDEEGSGLTGGGILGGSNAWKMQVDKSEVSG